MGQAIQESSIKREDIFVTSKLWVADFNYQRAKVGIDTSLQKLGLDYIGLYLLHQPYGDIIGAWRALEAAYQAGKIRAIGVSNFYADQLKNLELTVPIKPALNQIEVNPWYHKTRKSNSTKVRMCKWKPGPRLRKASTIFLKTKRL